MSMFTDVCAGMKAGDAMAKEIAELRARSVDLQRQLDEVTRERDQYKAACELADAPRNQERGS